MNKVTVIVLIITAILSSCKDGETPKQISVDSVVVPNKPEKKLIDTSSILLQMSMKRLELILDAKNADLKAIEAKSKYYLDGTQASYKAAKKAIREYNTAFNRYDSFDREMRRLYLAFHKTEMPKPTKFY